MSTLKALSRLGLSNIDGSTDILHLDMMGSHVIVLNNSDVAADLLERRSLISGDSICRPSDIPLTISALTATYHQPQLPMANELYELASSSVITDKRQLIPEWAALGQSPSCITGKSGVLTASYLTVSLTFRPQVSSTIRSTRQ